MSAILSCGMGMHGDMDELIAGIDSQSLPEVAASAASQQSEGNRLQTRRSMTSAVAIVVAPYAATCPARRCPQDRTPGCRAFGLCARKSTYQELSVLAQFPRCGTLSPAGLSEAEV